MLWICCLAAKPLLKSSGLSGRCTDQIGCFTGNGASLNASVSPSGVDTLVAFQWGATTNYGNTTANQAIGMLTEVESLECQYTEDYWDSTRRAMNVIDKIEAAYPQVLEDAGFASDHFDQPMSLGSETLPLRVETFSAVPLGSDPCRWSFPKRLTCEASRTGLM